MIGYCAHCGKKVERPQSQMKAKQIFCSKECHRLFGVSQVTCTNCGKVFERKKSQAKKSDNHFCGIICRGIWNALHFSGENSNFWKGGNVEAECVVCGQKVTRPKKQAETYRPTCSKECRSVLVSQAVSGPLNHKYKGMIDVECANCGASLKKYPCHVEAFERHFCNPQCQGEWRTKTGATRGANNGMWKGGLSEVPCSFCGTTLKRERNQLRRNVNNFCDNSCYSNWLSQNRIGPNNPLYQERVSIPCAQCGTLLERAQWEFDGRQENFFCNRKCLGKYASEHRVGENAAHWLGGYQEYYGPNWEHQRKAALDRDRHRCCNCKMTKRQNNGRELDVHHIVPFRNFEYVAGQNDNYLQANELTNLVSLCPSCHKLAEHGRIPVQLNLL